MVAGSLLAIPSVAQDAPRRSWEIKFPAPYHYADGRVLGFTEFRGTRVQWGQCTDDHQILEVEQEVMACSWCDKAWISVPDGRIVCVQAAVIGLDGEPMSRSWPVRFSTLGPRVKPEPVRVFAQ